MQCIDTLHTNQHDMFCVTKSMRRPSLQFEVLVAFMIMKFIKKDQSCSGDYMLEPKMRYFA